MTTWSNTFQLSNDRTLIPPLVRYLQDTTSQMGILQGSSGGETRIAVALEEALLNGMYHGNLEVDSSLRELDDSRFYELVETRRSLHPYRDRRLHVSANFDRDRAEFIIRDEGPGFDVSTVPDPTDAVNVERVCGRGMLLMRAFMDEVTYNEIGNQVRLVKWRIKTS